MGFFTTVLAGLFWLFPTGTRRKAVIAKSKH
jgi:hypothetical protein